MPRILGFGRKDKKGPSNPGKLDNKEIQRTYTQPDTDEYEDSTTNRDASMHGGVNPSGRKNSNEFSTSPNEESHRRDPAFAAAVAAAARNDASRGNTSRLPYQRPTYVPQSNPHPQSRAPQPVTRGPVLPQDNHSLASSTGHGSQAAYHKAVTGINRKPAQGKSPIPQRKNKAAVTQNVSPSRTQNLGGRLQTQSLALEADHDLQSDHDDPLTEDTIQEWTKEVEGILQTWNFAGAALKHDRIVISPSDSASGQSDLEPEQAPSPLQSHITSKGRTNHSASRPRAAQNKEEEHSQQTETSDGEESENQNHEHNSAANKANHVGRELALMQKLQRSLGVIKAIQEELRAAREEVVNLNIEKSRWEPRYQYVELERDHVGKERDEALAKYESALLRVSNLEKELADRKEKLGKTEGKVKGYTQEISEMKSQLGQKNKEIRDMQSSIKNKDEAIWAKDEEIRGMQTDSKNKNKIIVDMQIDVKDKEKTIRGMSTSIASKDNTILSMEASIEKRDEAIRGKDDTIRSMQAGIMKKDKEIRGMQTDIENKDEVIRGKDKAIRGMVISINNKDEKIVQHQELIDKLHDNLRAELQKQLELEKIRENNRIELIKREKEMNELTQQKKTEADSLKRQHRTAVEDLLGNHKTDTARLTQQYEDKLRSRMKTEEALRGQIDNERSAHSISMGEQKRNYETQLMNRERDRDEKEAKMIQDHDQATSDLVQAHQKKEEEWVADAAQKTRSLKQELEHLSAALIARDANDWMAPQLSTADLKKDPDEHIAEDFSQIEQLVEKLAGLKWKDSQKVWPSSLLTGINSGCGPKRLRQNILKNRIWNTLQRYVFGSPFRLLGDEGRVLEKQWSERYAIDPQTMNEDYTWPPPQVDTERWRYVTVRECRLALTQALPSEYDPRAKVKKGYKTNLTALIKELKSSLDEIAYLHSSNDEVIEELAKRMSSTWLNFGMHRCRIVISLRTPNIESTTDDTREIAEDALIVNISPGLGRYGNAKGFELDTYTTIGRRDGETMELS